LPQAVCRLSDVKRLDELSRVKLLAIDPVSSYMNAGGNVGVRRALAPLAQLAAEYELAMLLVSHLRKGEDKERKVGARCMKAIFEVFRKSRQPMKLSTIIMRIERRRYDLPRQGIRERIRRLKSNNCLSRQLDNAEVVYWFSDDLESGGDSDSR